MIEKERGRRMLKVVRRSFTQDKKGNGKKEKYSGENLLDSIKLNSILIIVGAGRLGPARRGSCDLCTRLTMKSGNNSCWMAGEPVYLDA